MKLKNYLFLMLALAGGVMLQSCNDDDDDSISVSPEIRNAFSQKYPHANGAKWETKAGFYVADFRNNAYDASAWFTPAGVWKMTETDLPYNALPDAVKAAFESGEYASWRKDDVDMLEREGMETVYVIEVESANHEYDLYYSEDGTLVKAVEDIDNEDDPHNPPAQLSATVETYIREHYQGARVIDIENERGMLEVEVVHDGCKKEILFNSQEEWASTCWDVSFAMLPQEVKDVLTAQYAGYRVDDAEFYEVAGGATYYLLDLEKNGSPDKDDVKIEGGYPVAK